MKDDRSMWTSGGAIAAKNERHGEWIYLRKIGHTKQKGDISRERKAIIENPIANDFPELDGELLD